MTIEKGNTQRILLLNIYINIAETVIKLNGRGFLIVSGLFSDDISSD